MIDSTVGTILSWTQIGLFLTPLHLKLCLAKLFTKSMDNTGNGLQYLCKKLGKVVSEAKLKAGFSNDPQIRMLF